MRKFIQVAAVLILLIGCRSPEKLLQKGDYDAAIDKSIKLIVKGKAKNEDKVLLDKAYKLANQRDQQRIDFLVRENRPENWEEIFHLYSALDYRQNKVQKVLPLTISGKQVNYSYVDYSAKIIEAKKKAADYYYKAGLKQMDINTKESCRQAYYDFLKVREYRPSDYPEVENLINDARYMGISRVLIDLDSRLPVKLPASFYDEVRSVHVSDLNSTWVEYHLGRVDRETTYDYQITIRLEYMEVTPPLEETTEYMRRKQIQDGFEYVLDSRGNVMKDSLGNDIKVPKYKNLACTVIKTRQFKSATVKGNVEFISINPKRLLKQEPVAATTIFEHISGKAVGDRDALLKEDWELIGLDEIPFPDDFNMLMDCAPILNQAITDAIRNNRNIIF